MQKQDKRAVLKTAIVRKKKMKRENSVDWLYYVKLFCVFSRHLFFLSLRNYTPRLLLV